MRMLLKVKIPHAGFNAAVKDGTIGAKLHKILETTKPEATYFTEEEGVRGAILVHNVAESFHIPALAEPWFLLFDADCHFSIAMTPEDLGKAGLDDIAKAWA